MSINPFLEKFAHSIPDYDAAATNDESINSSDERRRSRLSETFFTKVRGETTDDQ